MHFFYFFASENQNSWGKLFEQFHIFIYFFFFPADTSLQKLYFRRYPLSNVVQKETNKGRVILKTKADGKIPELLRSIVAIVTRPNLRRDGGMNTELRLNT